MDNSLKEANGYVRDFDKRELRLIKNCCDYAKGDPAGLPGHNLMIIISKLVDESQIDIAIYGKRDE